MTRNNKSSNMSEPEDAQTNNTETTGHKTAPESTESTGQNEETTESSPEESSEQSQRQTTENKYLWRTIIFLLIAIALSLWLGFSLHTNIERATNNPKSYDPGNYAVVFFFLSIFTFVFYVFTTMQMRLYKKRAKWYGWLGTLGPLGVIILAFVKVKQPEPEPEPEPEPAGPIEETLDVETIQVRTSDGRIMNLRTVKEEQAEAESTEENQQQGEDEQSQGEQENRHQQGEQNEEGKTGGKEQTDRNYNINDNNRNENNR